MKTIAIIIALVLGTMTVQAQGWLGYTLEELKEESKDAAIGYTLTQADDVDGLIYEMSNNQLLWLFYFNENGRIYFTMLNFKNPQIMGMFLQSYNESYASMGELIWKNYIESGVVTMELHPEKPKHWPWVGYKYEQY